MMALPTMQSAIERIKTAIKKDIRTLDTTYPKIKLRNSMYHSRKSKLWHVSSDQSSDSHSVCYSLPVIAHQVSRSARMAARMACRLAFTGSIRNPSRVRTGFTKATSLSTNSTTRTLPSGWREASKTVRGGNNSAEQIRPFLSATSFMLELSRSQRPFQAHSSNTRRFRREGRAGDPRKPAAPATLAEVGPRINPVGTDNSLFKTRLPP